MLALEAAELNRFALRLPADPTRLSVLRKRLEDFLVAHRVGEDDLFDLTVAVSEAAANAIEHPVDAGRAGDQGGGDDRGPGGGRHGPRQRAVAGVRPARASGGAGWR